MNRGNRSHVLVLTLALAAIVASADGQSGVLATRTAAAAQAPGSSCAVIMAVDRATGLVTAKVSAKVNEGVMYRFRVSDPKTLAALQVGMVIYGPPSGGTTRSAQTKGASGTTSCGSNVDRNTNTVASGPKTCVVYDAAGKPHNVVCP
jgi:hypothetical protein